MARPHRPQKAERNSRQIAELLSMPMLSLADIAIILDLSVATLDKMRAEGKMPPMFKIGRKLYVTRSKLLAWIEATSKVEA